MDGHPLGFKCGSEEWSHCWVGMKQNHVIGGAGLGEGDQLGMACMIREVESFHLTSDISEMAMDLEASFLLQLASAAANRLISGQKNRAAFIQALSIEVPECGATVEHAAGRDDDVCLEGSFAIGS